MRGRVLIVAPSRSRGALAAVRAFHRAGWVVGVGSPDARSMIARSRFAAAVHQVPRPRGDGAAFVEGIRRACAEAPYDVAFGGGDDWVAGLAVHRDELPVQVGHPDWSVVSSGLDKLHLTATAAQVGLEAPRTVSADDVHTWDGPVIVKCRSHWFPGQQHPLRVEARRFPSLEAARGRIEEVRRAGFEPLLQEPIDGGLSALIGLVHEGRLLGRVQQEAHGLWPTPSGVSSRAITVPVDEDLADRSEALLKTLDWTGLVELQFLTPADGRPRLIDLNGRFYGSMALALRAGPNLVAAWGDQALGRPLPPLPDGEPGVRYLWAAGDLRRASAERRGGLLRDVATTIAWGAAGAARSVWDVHDPGPFLHLVRARLRRSVADTVS